MTDYINDQEKLKSRHEEFHLSIFSTLHRLPGEEIRRQNSGQKPDFLYRAGELVVGIEHTELKRTKSALGKFSLAHLKGLHRQIIRRAADLAEKQGIPPLDVKVWFNDYYDCYPNKGGEAVQGLLNCITANLDRILATEYGNSIKIGAPDPFVGISQIYARSGKVCSKVWLTAHRWKVIEPIHVSRTFLSELQDAIDTKNEEIDNYLKNCDDCWLLVVADRTKADQCYCLTPEIKSHRFVSTSRKTFFLEIAEGELIELSPGLNRAALCACPYEMIGKKTGRRQKPGQAQDQPLHLDM